MFLTAFSVEHKVFNINNSYTTTLLFRHIFRHPFFFADAAGGAIEDQMKFPVENFSELSGKIVFWLYS